MVIEWKNYACESKNQQVRVQKTLHISKYWEMIFDLFDSDQVILTYTDVGRQDVLLQHAHLPNPSVIQIANRRNV